MKKLKDVIYYIVQKLGDNVILTRTKVVKLVFLADYKAKQEFDRTITGTRYTYYLYGPYSPKIVDAINDMVGYELVVRTTALERGHMYQYKINDAVEHDISLSDEEIGIIDDIIKKYGQLPLQELVATTYKITNLEEHAPLEIILK